MENLFGTLTCLRGLNITGIYLLQINNKRYIGSSVNIKKRLRRHRTLLRNNKHDNKYLQNLYNKYNKCEFKILEICDKNITSLELRTKEKEYIINLNVEINIGDPVLGMGGTLDKEIYQYTKEGQFIKKWSSATEAAKILKVSCAPLHSCANPNVKVSKSAYGFIWSYEELNNINYSNNTGSNLEKRAVILTTIDKLNSYEFISLSEAAKFVVSFIKYKGDWKNIRTIIGYALKSPNTRTVRKLFTVAYK